MQPTLTSYRARHVKCGEEKPNCKNCVKSNRECKYKINLPIERHENGNQVYHGPRWSLSADNCLKVLPGTMEEREFVHIFCTKTARMLSGYSTSDLWCRLLPQLSHHEPTVRHAVVALSAAHAKRPSSSRALQKSHEVFVLEQYSKAIQSLRLLLSKAQGPCFTVLLVTCLLFSGLEMLHGNERRALDHLEGGMKILSSQWQAQTSMGNSSVDRELFQVLYRLNIQLPYFGRTLIPLNISLQKLGVKSHERPLTFDNIAQAREVMANLMQRSILLSATIRMSGENSPESRLLKHEEEQRTLLRETEMWYMAFTEMMKKPAKDVGILDPRAPWILQIEYHTGMVWIPCISSREQLAYDNYLSHFEAVFHAAEQVVRLSEETNPEHPGSKSFCLDTELLPMLYWTVTKCRFPLLRRKAISTLSRYSKQEGIWDAQLYCRILQRVMEIEEAPVASLPVDKRIPAEAHRLHDVRVNPENGLIQTQVSVFMTMKPHGLDGEWMSWWEYVE